ncbi:MAG: PAS domain S-box protein [Pseudomonadota bacterium]
MINTNLNRIRQSLVSKLILSVGLILLISMSTWAYFNIKYLKEKVISNIKEETDRLSNTIKLGTHYAMMLNSRDDINQIINNIGKQPEIKNIRLYNKDGQIKFSKSPPEIDSKTNIRDEACYICHKSEPPQVSISLDERTRIFYSDTGYRLLGIISPIENEPGCSTGNCHFHSPDKKILGALDVVISLEGTDKEILRKQKEITALALFVFILSSAIIFVFVLRFVNRPVKRLIEGTKQIAKGNYGLKVEIGQDDEMGQLASAINHMGKEIGENQAELNRQRDEYQNLFELVPCIITVQDRDYKLIQYNREFADKFAPKPGDYCYQAYKGRNEKCVNCPVEKTFLDGKSHYSEETGYNKDGTLTHWIVNTSPIKNSKGEIIATMEMNLDITIRKNLEEKFIKSEKKYHEIFNNIPNPVFVLDMDSLDILDCNESVTTVYGFTPNEIINQSFLAMFREDEREKYAFKMRVYSELSQVKQIKKDGNIVFVNIRISPSEYPGQKVFLVTTSDITKRLEAEQQLIQASKMATLGEMATGVAHELNQPLTVMKTASSFLIKKVVKKEAIPDDVLLTLAEEIDRHVDRATKIINHMRQFGRKSELTLEKVQINRVLESAFEIFSQQLKVRGIKVVWETEENLPLIMADTDRLEQVFINLLINARDSIEERCEKESQKSCEKRISIKTQLENEMVAIIIKDTGTGIPVSISEKIFEPFFTTKKVGQGTGLGLSISYGIIQDCKGSIKVVPSDEGACFVIRFPVLDE